MYWLKRLSINLIALALATFIGMVAVSQAVYVFDANVGRLPIAPFIRGFVASLIVAAIAPKTAFLPRFLVFSGIFLADLLLSIIISNMTIVMLDRYWGGNQDGAGLWMYGVGSFLLSPAWLAIWCCAGFGLRQRPVKPMLSGRKPACD
ncbi:MAG: hypothetical protein E5X53_32910 [Mesorhizobium sp.]|uniref:hypothetical protein n=1 Tax=Mesorhizobium sp. TaxID=1871066 RepID=UPI00120702F4|nr:hypothetical protein [Mesorhizobium sp.]TIR47668.1 MAG: hypothetical protein E5X53_32910 [Mesorhizobium sp.]